MNDTIQFVFQRQQEFKHTLRGSTVQQRLTKLRRLKKAIEHEEAAIYEALHQDLRKNRQEAAISEVFFIYSEIAFAIKHLSRWMKPHPVGRSITNLTAKSQITYQAKGCCLIIAPWNYPFQLTMSPLVSAIAAGNCAIVKPSEYSLHVSAVVQRIINNSFAQEEIHCIQGDQTISEYLLQLPFDHIFFTGSPQVGKLVMQAASMHLTSVTLELGGKSPALVDEYADVEKAAKKIAWGKLINAGQTCIAPDYIFIHHSLKAVFVNHYIQAVKEMFYTVHGEIDRNVYSRIINTKHAERLKHLLDEALTRGASLVFGGQLEADMTFLPTVLDEVPLQSRIMHEEIFGPILPILSFQNLDEAISHINRQPKPLALYLFSENKSHIRQVLQTTSSGGACVNDVLIHVSNPHLPFGGINNSGMGSCHGFFGFKTFSHERAVMYQSKYSASTWIYPPYDEKNWMFLWLRRWL